MSNLSFGLIVVCSYCIPTNKADLITQRIIPTIAWMRSQMPISLQRIFPSSFLTCVGAGDTLDCTDLVLTDGVFNIFRQECIIYLFYICKKILDDLPEISLSRPGIWEPGPFANQMLLNRHLSLAVRV